MAAVRPSWGPPSLGRGQASTTSTSLTDAVLAQASLRSSIDNLNINICKLILTRPDTILHHSWYNYAYKYMNIQMFCTMYIFLTIWVISKPLLTICSHLLRWQQAAGIWDISNLLALGHKQLWGPLTANSCLRDSRMLWPQATTNCGCLWLQNSIRFH